MMTLHFGVSFDGPVYFPAAARQADVLVAGPKKLLRFLEQSLGLSGYAENSDYLRIELYRQSLQALAPECTEPPFFAASFEADRFATATVLLERRDALLLAGWNFDMEADTPERLRLLARAEVFFQQKIHSAELAGQALGFADRFNICLDWLPKNPLSLHTVHLYEPLAWYPPHLQCCFKVLEKQGVIIQYTPDSCAAPAHTRLGRLQRSLCGMAVETPAEADAQDASLLILKNRRDSDAAVVLAQMLRENPDFRPLLLVPEMNLGADIAVALEGLPSMGILSSSLARPSLQALKLAPAFLWEPVDVYKIMEFATLPVKPMDEGLSLEIARVLAERPGLFSDPWFAAVYGYLERAEVPEDAREQYEFWFNRRRYRSDSTAPKKDAEQLYDYLCTWARDFYEKNGRKNPSLLVLSGQAGRIRDLLEALPEPRIGFLELERIVRTVYDPSPAQLLNAETECLAYVHHPGAVAESTPRLLWWNLCFEAAIPPPDGWTEAERRWLAARASEPDRPEHISRLQRLLQYRPVLQCSNQLILWTPEQIAGQTVVPALLLGDIEACLGKQDRSTFQTLLPEDRARLQPLLRTPAPHHVQARTIGRPQPFLQVPMPERLRPADYETPTNLENLFYYPHRWFFRQKMRIYPGGMLHIATENTLYGNLAHRFFEMLLQENLTGLDKPAVIAWVEAQAARLLEREGATLLLYGREPERNAFLNRIKNAAWSLIEQLRSNNWTVVHTELDLEGAFRGIPLRGKADLVLQRGDEWAIVDLKWGGANRRKELIRNEEDLQLILYAHLLGRGNDWPHTAYFILEDGKMIARNRAAFRDAVLTGNTDADHREAAQRILQKMEHTLDWRLEQIAKGQVEIRTARTAPELEALYEATLLEVLEMKNEDARWDDYRTLLDFMG
jgi:ATP-dependent helicase/nuclease subunit B